jgi:hypothetical protein
VILTEAEVERDRCAVGSRGFFDVHYGDFCREPRETLEKFAEFYLSYTGHALKKRHEIPRQFPPNRSIDIPPVEVETIKKHLGYHATEAAVRKIGWQMKSPA